MERRKTALWLLLFLIFLTLFSSWLVHGSCLRILERLDRISALCRLGQYEDAEQEITGLQAEYHRRSHLMALFLRRDHLGSLRISISGLSAYAVPENLQDLESEISRAKAQLYLMDHLFFSLL